MPKSPSTFPVESPPGVADSQSQTSVTTNTPEKWAEVYFPSSARGRQHPDLWKHASAMQLHGWAAFVARTGKPVELTAEQYEKATAAVSGSDFKPHTEADYRSRS